jgi:hypothetical protein
LLVLVPVDIGGVTSPTSVPRDDSLPLGNVCEMRAPTAEYAAFLLDAAIGSRTVPGQCLPQYLINIVSCDGFKLKGSIIFLA